MLLITLILMCDGSLRQVLTHFQVFLSLDPGLGLIVLGSLEIRTANKRLHFWWGTPKDSVQH